MLVAMRDSVAPDKLANWSGLVAGYIDGRVSAWRQSAWAQFGSRAARISVLANPQADVFDLESGNATVTQVLAAVKERAAVARRSIVYTSSSNWTVAEKALAAQRSWIDWWIADWDGKMTLPAGAIAHQYATEGGYDLSVVSPLSWWPARCPVVGSLTLDGVSYSIC